MFENHEEENDDEECFAVDNLDEYKLIKSLTSAATVKQSNAEAQDCALQALARLRRAGGLPFRGFGDLKQQELQQTVTTMLRSWFDEQARFPDAAERQSVRVETGVVVLEDWIDQLRCGAEFAGAPAWLELEPGKLCVKDRKEPTPRLDKLSGAWIRSLAIAASGLQAHGVMVGRDSVIEIAPVSQETAITTLTMLLELWLAGMQAPLPLPPRTALVWLEDNHKAAASYEGGFRIEGEGKDSYLARVYPDFEALSEDGRFAVLSEQVYGQLNAWAAQHVTARYHASAEAVETGQAA
jgi:exodeoxyribonuclease V gamma subunit